MSRRRLTTARNAPAAGSSAFAFVLTMGIVNLFADMTYEGGASINGQFLGSLGASAAAVSILAGAGECLGYGLRALAGYLADRTGKYWPITFVGYAVNLLAVPSMAMAPGWPAAGALILAERVGRAFRKPTVEAMLSYSTGKHGRGWVYAVNTAMDETGATLGPLLIASALYLRVDLRSTYGLLLIPSLLALLALTAARITFPVPARLQEGGPKTAQARGFTRAYWLYMAAGSCFAAGLMSFEFIAYHLSATGTVTEQWLPVYLAAATAFAVIASLVLGRTYDRIGIGAVVGAVLVTAAFSPLVFFGGVWWWALTGLFLWGVGYAVQDTLLKVLIASVLPEGRRNYAFGLFYIGYGGGWLVGSVAAGLLYEWSLTGLVGFAVAAQLASVPVFVMGSRASRSPTRPHRAWQP
jgi:MFS family permease